MAYAVQYDLFESNDELSLTKRELDLVKKELANVRKGLFSRLGNLKEEFSDKFNKQQYELELLKKRVYERPKVFDFPTIIQGKKC